ncbi:MAG: L-threonylcarbamoyladenylate synthase [Bdellovibrionales bacterium]|nr:L-threonylcarbamoyladenylate synthase [Bdellovibrionales bacterium]
MRFTTRIHLATSDAIQEAAQLLKAGEVVGLPTETVYGLAANAHNANAVKEIFNVKQRPAFDPLIVHVSDQHLQSPAGPLASLSLEGTIAPQVATWKNRAKIELLIARYWPGPLTLVLPKGLSIPDVVTSGQPTVGIRCPAHLAFQQVLAATKFPLAAPSANLFGRISPTRAQHVYRELGGQIQLIIDGGPCTVGVESTIIQIIDEPFTVKILRPGKIAADEIERLIGTPVTPTPGIAQTQIQKQGAVAPGMLDEHYAPTKPLILTLRPFSQMVPSMVAVPNELKGKKVGILSTGPLLDSFWNTFNPVKVIELSHQAVPQEIAQRLFLSLRELDEDQTVDWILADVPEPTSGLGLAIRDRLNRASRNKPLD